MPSAAKRNLTSEQEQPQGQLSKKPRRAVQTRRTRRKKQKYFNFMGLPLELRIFIYKTLIVGDRVRQVGAIHVDFKKNGRVLPFFQTFKVSESAALFTSMFLVSKQVSREATDVFYGYQLMFADTFVLQTFLTRIQPETLAHIRYIGLASWEGVPGQQDNYRTPTFALLRGAKNLKQIQFPDDMIYNGLPYSKRELFGAIGDQRPSAIVGKNLALLLYRYCYPIITPLVEQGKDEKVRETMARLADFVKLPDIATYYWHGYTRLGAGCQHLDMARRERQEDCEECRTEIRRVMFRTLVKLHRGDPHVQYLLKYFGGPQS
ncbi:hypothetical protein VP1G_00628 [Cytospora mali]|uniref:Uncharacterized protein n=1 Tax=Cytospora mali TaxID=578113 RepID=A0A194UNM1_CYTMA|nr:hypothetical protein VP1G_00628 [Valsa mali var. pyri (nom. inval.)]